MATGLAAFAFAGALVAKGAGTCLKISPGQALIIGHEKTELQKCPWIHYHCKLGLERISVVHARGGQIS